MKKIAVFVGSLFILLSFIVGSSLAKSYSLKTLSSEVSVEGCNFNVVEYFDYEFVGSYSRIGRPFYSTYSIATNINVTILSNSNGINSTTISASIQTLNETQYFIMNMNPSTPDNVITRISFKLSYTFYPNYSLFYKYINAGIYSNETYFRVGYYFSNNPPIENLISTLILPNVKYVINPEPWKSYDYDYIGEMINKLTVRFTQRMSYSFYPYVKFLPLVTTPFDECAIVVNMSYRPTPYTSNGPGLIAFEIFAIVVGSLAGAILIVSCTACFIVYKRKNPNTKDESWFFYIRTCGFCWCFHGKDGGGGGGDSEMNTGYTSFNDNSNDCSNSNNWDSGGGNDNWGSSGGGGGAGFAD